MDQEYICLEITEECNNACQHCYNFWRGPFKRQEVCDGESLSREGIRNLIKKIQTDIPLKYAAVTGGEPTLRADFPGIVCDLVDLGVSPAVITNGAMLTESLLSKLPRDIVFEITLLGHNALLHDTLAGNKVFDDVIYNASRIEKHGSQLVVAFVATKFNALDVFRVVELGIALGADAFMYNRVNVSYSTRKWIDKLVPSPRVLSESLGSLQHAVNKYGVDAVCSVPVPPCLVDIEQFPSLDFGWCPRGGSDAYYTVDRVGHLRPCNHASKILGDLRTHGFAEIISSDVCKSFWEVMPSECADCTHPLKEECHGGCTAASYEFHGSQDYIDPFCTLTKGLR